MEGKDLSHRTIVVYIPHFMMRITRGFDPGTVTIVTNLRNCKPEVVRVFNAMEWVKCKTKSFTVDFLV